MLDERRKNLSKNRTRSLNQLHALPRESLPGGMPTDLTATKASNGLRGLRPGTDIDRVRKPLARDLIAEIKRYDTQLTDNAAAMSDLLDRHDTTLRDIAGVGPVLAARIVGGTHRQLWRTENQWQVHRDGCHALPPAPAEQPSPGTVV